VIHYASSATRCRSQLLLEYFGEKDSVRCGQCDVCKSVEVLEMSNVEFEKIRNRIKSIIEEPCTYENLLFKLNGNQEKMRQTVKWLLDNNKIIYRIDNKLEWSEN
jgi:ATP-dependent DNA helicase RecQ